MISWAIFRSTEILNRENPMFAASFAPRRCSLVSLFAPIAFALSSSLTFADGTGWYNSSQIAKGRFEYSQNCAVCHGAQLQGTGAPAKPKG